MTEGTDRQPSSSHVGQNDVLNFREITYTGGSHQEDLLLLSCLFMTHDLKLLSRKSSRDDDYVMNLSCAEPSKDCTPEETSRPPFAKVVGHSAATLSLRYDDYVMSSWCAEPSGDRTPEETSRRPSANVAGHAAATLDLQSRRQSRSCNASPVGPPLADCFKVQVSAIQSESLNMQGLQELQILEQIPGCSCCQRRSSRLVGTL